MKKTLDFICIGAAKSATTTLFEHIKDHPEIYLPKAKEAPYFSDKDAVKKGWNWYINNFFSKAGASKTIGTITPQYMSGGAFASPEKICEEIHKKLPDTRIIAVLRHPVFRSYSHYKMHRRFGYINTSFDNAVSQLLNLSKRDLVKEHRQLSQRRNIFLFASEYGHILKCYYEQFPKYKIHIIYTDDIKNKPQFVLKQLFDFLGVDNSYRPKNIEQRSHMGGGQPRNRLLTQAYLKKIPGFNYVWKNLLPARLRSEVFIKISRWNIKPSDDRLDPSSDLYKRLVDYFKDDIKLLEKETATKVPWKDWK